MYICLTIYCLGCIIVHRISNSSTLWKRSDFIENNLVKIMLIFLTCETKDYMVIDPKILELGNNT